ncbi:LTA synthase family protein [Lactobacillus sp. YT155]|uniref:LTA synthase family protein n=1 Tax=Lactobacillus sp. YT155 TaxID=3060955 RepID=UPI00265FAB21|nr:LTA synthase family protein [Lactobacillus sp. YT155]MDO1605676.1 LTA synthase family protein [Lactobacillus sp. YT155]
MYIFIFGFVILPILAAIFTKNDTTFKILAKTFLVGIASLLISLFLARIYTHNPIVFNDVIFTPTFSIKFCFILLIVYVLVYFSLNLLERWTSFSMVEKNFKKNRLPYGSIGAAFLITIGYFLLKASYWTNYNFNLLTPEQIIYNLTQPMEGTAGGFVDSFIIGPLLQSLLLLIFLSIIFIYLRKFNFSFKILNRFFNYRFLGKWIVVPSLIISLVLTSIAAVEIKAKDFYDYFTTDSTFIKKNYVEPTANNIKFPKHKRNLIYIYAESLESTSISKELGGQQSQNLLPELTELSRQGIHFSNSEKEFGGAQQLSGTGWTIAGMVAQTSGLPLKIPVDGNSYANNKGDKFLPGVISLNDILEKEGYNQVALFGSDATFGGRRSYFKEHGNVKIDDYLAAKKEGRISKDYKVWWGYEDSKLFEYAKQDVTKLSQQNKPFNLTMLTANTHHIGGYTEKGSPQPYGNKYSNVIAFSDHQIVEFVKWAQQQDFYKNTTIIINGDHLSMDTQYYKGVKDRHTFNLILNAPQEADKSKIKTTNRQFGTIDMFPTTLAALGVEVKGNRLGLGTNLLSNKETLVEKYGFVNVSTELSAVSKYYNNKFINGQ